MATNAPIPVSCPAPPLTPPPAAVPVHLYKFSKDKVQYRSKVSYHPLVRRDSRLSKSQNYFRSHQLICIRCEHTCTRESSTVGTGRFKNSTDKRITRQVFFFSQETLVWEYSKISASVILARQESHLSIQDSRIERHDSCLSRNETRLVTYFLLLAVL